MKLAFVLDDTLDTHDGVQQYVLLLASWLQVHDHEVHFLVSKTTRTDLNNLHDLSKHLRLKFNRNTVPFVLPTSPKKIAALLEREQFDVLHVQMPYHPAFGARVIDLAPPSTAIVGTFHIAPYAKRERSLSKLLGWVQKPSVRRFDAIMSVSEPAQELLRTSYKVESTIVPNMVDAASYRLRTKRTTTSPPEIVFLGRLVERKGCQHFIQALARLKQPFHATIIGDGRLRAKLEASVQSHNLGSHIEFVGRVSEKDKRALLSKASIAIFPATGGESFGIVLLEAMAAGSCVVLAGDNPGYRSVMGSISEAMIDPTDHECFAERITSFMTDEILAQTVYDQQQALVSQFDVNAVAPKVLAVYHRAVASAHKKSHTR